MTSYALIVTHPGGAHADEFLACSVLLATHPAPIVRREPSGDDLASPEICVVDVGQRHEPARLNFDHHQLPKDHPPTCALSLVLQHLGLYDDARQFCDWLEPVEYFDTRGPMQTARWLGTTPDVLNRLHSPVQTALLRRFVTVSRLEQGEPLWEMMRVIGRDIVDYLTSLRARLDFLADHTEFWRVDVGGRPAQVLFVPRTEPLPAEPGFGLDRFVQSRGLENEVIAIVSPDRRGQGYGLERYRDNPRLDFTRIEGHPGVHFAHARGFVAKTSLTEPEELRELLARAAVPDA